MWSFSVDFLLNRLVAVAQVLGPKTALAELAELDSSKLAAFPPYQAVWAEVYAALGRTDDVRGTYERCWRWIPRRRNERGCRAEWRRFSSRACCPTKGRF